MKAAFTRTYNKESSALPYAVVQGVSKKKSKAVEEGVDDEDEEEEEEDDDDPTKDAMIKVGFEIED